MIEGSNILITGGSGSFGQAFARYILGQKPARVVIYSRGEHRQEEMERSLNDPRLRFFIGDVRDLDRLEMAMRGVDYVVHAAAMKVVPKCEHDPIEAVRTNIIGAENVIRSALKCRVQKVLALSTDKACAPVNLYGATKLAAEKLFVAASNLRGDLPTRFSVVRYGNVWGSQGSVVPLFQKLKAEGKPFTITDKNMTRFIITMDRAVFFVRYALEHMDGTEIFVPKIPSASIMDIAQAVGPGHPQSIIGVRPGEKIHETLITEDEAVHCFHQGLGYVIHQSGGPKPVIPATTGYTSNQNDVWLSVEQLRQLLT